MTSAYDHDDEHISDDEHLTNPAGRLLLLFRDSRGRVVGFAGLIQLPVQARSQIAALERPAIPKRTLARPFDTVEVVLPLAATARLAAHDFASRIDSGVHNDLEATSAILRHHAATRAIDVDTLTKIRDIATEVIDRLTESNIPGDVRESIRRHALRIINSVSLYKVHGADALINEMDGLTGAVVRNAREIPGFVDHPLVKKVTTLGNVIAAATTIIGAPFAIASGINYLAELTSSTSISDEVPPPLDDNEIVVEPEADESF